MKSAYYQKKQQVYQIIDNVDKTIEGLRSIDALDKPDKWACFQDVKLALIKLRKCFEYDFEE